MLTKRKQSQKTRVHKAKPLLDVHLRLAAIEQVVTDLDGALRQAIARKPNAVLTRLVYELKMTRVELAAVQEQLAANNSILERYARAPVLDASTGAATATAGRA